MRRLFGLFCLCTGLLAVSASHFAFADDDDEDEGIIVCKAVQVTTLPNGNHIFVGPIVCVDLEELLECLQSGAIIVPAGEGEVGQCCSFCRTPDGGTCPPRRID